MSAPGLSPAPGLTTGPLLLRFDPQPEAEPLAKLGPGTRLIRIEPASDGWCVVEYQVGNDDAAGYALASTIQAALGGATDELSAANDRFWELTLEAVGRGVGYGFGVGVEGLQAHPPRIQCSSWVAYLLQAGFRQAGDVAGRSLVDPGVLAALNVYSDAMVVEIARLTHAPPAGPTLAATALRPGLVIGVDTGRHAWEANAHRVYGIDHVVLVVRNPVSGELYVSHSSSSPPHDDEGTLATGVAGVSCIHVGPWLRWARTSRLFAVDAFALARP